MEHKLFFRGVIFGIALVAFTDLLFVHLIMGSHRSYNHPSVNIVEPLVVVVALIIIVYILYKEFKK